jgi:hypothetical protein
MYLESALRLSCFFVIQNYLKILLVSRQSILVSEYYLFCHLIQHVAVARLVHQATQFSFRYLEEFTGFTELDLANVRRKNYWIKTPSALPDVPYLIPSV